MNGCQHLLLQRGSVCMLKPLARYKTVRNIPHILLEALTGSKRWSIRPPPIRHASGNRKIWINGSVYDKVSPVFAVATGLQRHFTSHDMEKRSRGQRVDATVTGTKELNSDLRTLSNRCRLQAFMICLHGKCFFTQSVVICLCKSYCSHCSLFDMLTLGEIKYDTTAGLLANLGTRATSTQWELLVKMASVIKTV